MTVPSPPAHWLTQAVFYEIYPQSFADSDGDGVGDFPGALARLDHLAWLGVNTIWFNPCFASPFTDAGYDVADYLRVAPRYGTNDDLVRFVAAARDRGIRVLLDLVAGHTSSAHPWFVASAADPTDDRYIWADGPGEGFVASPGPRPGYYLKNFYDTQPALNFGYARLEESKPWRQPVDAPGPLANRAALREIMAFWLDRGVAGFRVDMAFSLVKDDPGYVATIALWRELRGWLDRAYPDAVIIPEGVEPSTDAAPAFHADFFLVIHDPHSSLFNNGGAGTLPWIDPVPCFFDAAGAGSTATLLRDWQEHQELVRSGPAGAARLRRPRLLPDGLRITHRRAARRGVHVPAQLADRALDLLRRRDRDALPAGPARRRGLGRAPDLQPGRRAHPDAVGRRTQRRLLHAPHPSGSTCRSTRRRTARR